MRVFALDPTGKLPVAGARVRLNGNGTVSTAETRSIGAVVEVNAAARKVAVELDAAPVHRIAEASVAPGEKLKDGAIALNNAHAGSSVLVVPKKN